MTLPAPTLEHVADLTGLVAAPVEAGQVRGVNSRGLRRIIPITGGSVTGRLRGRVLPGGADFQIAVSDTLAELDARYLLGLEGGEPVDPAAIYFRCVPSFEVSDPALAWLTESLSVGTGVRHPDRVELSVFRLG